MGKVIAAFIGALVVGLLFITFVIGWGVLIGREAGIYNEESRRIIQNESRAFQEGMAQNLDKLCLEYDMSGNVAIAAAIRHRVAGYNGTLPEHVQDCVDNVRNVK
jgi:hypothetical protein